MSNTRRLVASATVIVSALGFCLAPASAGPTDLAPLLGTGWQYDQASSVSTPSDGSPLTFTAASGAYAFSIVDGYIPGDVYQITLNGVQVWDSTFGLTATPFDNNLGPYAATFAPDWTDPTFSRFELWFGPGSYSFVIEDTSSGIGFPAGFGFRLDSLPEPFTLSLFGAGVAGAVVMRRRKKAA